MRWHSLSLLALLALPALAQERVVNVGLFRDQPPHEVLATSAHGSFKVITDGRSVGELSSKDAVRISVNGNTIVARSLAASWTAERTIALEPVGRSMLHLSVLTAPKAERDYPGSIIAQRTGHDLTLINAVPLETYVAGVVQSEAGDNKATEYYKLQAVSCRTYALANLRRHAGEGFHVCDGTHCQVYKGRCTLEQVVQAVEATRNLVAVDADIHLIHATFHSNCGGETMNAEDLWSKSEPYLVSAMDTFCLSSPHAEWRRTMPKQKWMAYLHQTYGIDPNDSATLSACTHFAPGCRSLYIDGARPLIPLEQVRADMKFNSAWFDIHDEGDLVVFDGRGFGHGVGLCQEGAMNMARCGIPFTSILHHYFSEVHLVDLNTLDFFRD